MMNPLPGSSGSKVIVNVYLYKAGKGSGLFNFQHDLRTLHESYANAYGSSTETYTSVGPDPSDLDMTSEAVLKQLQDKSLGRLPYDCWIPRDLDTRVSTITGIPTIASTELTATQKSYFSLEDMDKQLRLSWKNLSEPKTYASDFKSFLQGRKTQLLAELGTVDPLNIPLDVYNLTPYLVDYTHTTQLHDFVNSIDLSLMSDPRSLYSAGNQVSPMSSASMGSAVFQGSVIGNADEKQVPVIEENDIVEIRVKYVTNQGDKPYKMTESCFIDDNGFQRTFIGFVTAVSRTFKYGKQESVSLQCHGLSKMFHIYDANFTPSLSTSEASVNDPNPIFELGLEMSNLSFSLWGNRFNDMHAYDIFNYFMSSAMFSSSTQYYTKRKAELNEKLAKAQAYLKAIPVDTNTDAGTATTAIDRRDAQEEVAKVAKEITGLQLRINDLAKNHAAVDALLTRNLSATLSGEIKPPKGLDVQLYTSDTHILPDNLSFQTINSIPVLMSLARTYASSRHLGAVTKDNKPVKSKVKSGDMADIKALSGVFGSVEQGFNVPYKLLMQTAFNQFYPELKKPSHIFADLRAATFLEIFEDRPGVLRMRPPKYNIMNLNLDIKDFPSLGEQSAFALAVPGGTAQVNGEYVISPQDVLSVAVARNDAAILTRADHTWTLPLSNSQALPGHTGHYTDPAYISKYGLRTTGPLQHPMAMSPMIASYLSAIALATRNGAVRTVALSVMNNKEYQIGRLYYIPVSIPYTKGKDAVVSKGIVGYLQDIKTQFTYNNPPSHSLTLTHVRQAEILEMEITGSTTAAGRALSLATAGPLDLGAFTAQAGVSSLSNPLPVTQVATTNKVVYFANFKRLPDISTYMRLLATDAAVNQDFSAAVNNKGNDLSTGPGGGSSFSYGDELTIANGVGAHNATGSLDYAGTLAAMKMLPTTTTLGDASGREYQFEQNVFLTGLSASAFMDTVNPTLNVSKNLLAKLVVYGADPYTMLYPPIEHASGLRGTRDLLRVVNILAQKYVQQVATSTPATLSGIKDSLASLSTAPTVDTGLSAAGRAHYCAKIGTPNSKVKLAGSEYFTRYKVVSFVCSDPTTTRSTDINWHMVACVIDCSWGSNNNIRKLLFIHVPYTKSLRLANLINTGMVGGGGGRGTEKAKAVSGSALPTTDPHTAGAAVGFSDIQVATWALTDIAESCVEVDYSDTGGQGLSDDTPNDPALAAQYTHMVEAYVNITAEPGILGSNSNVSPAMRSPSTSVVLKDARPGVYNGVNMGTLGAKEQRAIVDSVVDTTVNNLRDALGDTELFTRFDDKPPLIVPGRPLWSTFVSRVEAAGPVMVPVADFFYTTYFGNLALIKQQFSDKKLEKDERSLLVMVDNRAKFLSTSVADWANIARIEVDYTKASGVTVLGTTSTDLAGYIATAQPAYPAGSGTYKLHIVELVDNLFIANDAELCPVTAKLSPGEERLIWQHPVSYVWHLSYIPYLLSLPVNIVLNGFTFQTSEAVFRAARYSKGKLDLGAIARTE